MTPEEMATAGAATDWAAVGQQVEALQQRIDEMGPVNLVAIEEYEETEQRYQFLSKQHDDLVQAKAQLIEVINRINIQTRQMFRETFEQIRDNFRAMFTEVFGGGKADLLLVDENNLLESGIDIIARPPGKQLQTISLLSGGEQTMTAVALLFSIYQVKPSPFCVLDELDAPLDESNINRFIRVLQRFLAHSQFVVITHNKRTIGMADVLYGVTMQEHGVSKIVSVKFHKADEAVTDHQPATLETPAPGRPIEQEEDAPHKREDTLEIVMAK
jgi:chromosome segregation protein